MLQGTPKDIVTELNATANVSLGNISVQDLFVNKGAVFQTSKPEMREGLPA